MLLDNYAATLYPRLKITTTDGETFNEAIYTNINITSISSENYLERGGTGYFNMFSRGIAFGSGTTPPRKQIIS